MVQFLAVFQAAALLAVANLSGVHLGGAVAQGGDQRSVPQPARLATISQAVFGVHARTAECIAHYESTDGAYLFNGSNLGPWQINVAAHSWVDGRRVVSDWWYSARVAYRISVGGRDWSAWSTHRLCGV